MSIAPLLSEGWIVASHALIALLALGLGIWQLAGAKGTARHRKVGYAWAGLMMAVAASSFWIHDLRLIGPFSPIHLLSALVLINVPIAIHAARRTNIQKHRRYMQSLFFLGLVATGLFTMMPGRVMHEVVFGP